MSARKEAVLRSHRWFKLICGASYQDLPTIRNLTLVYTLAGADCIDVGADPALVHSAREGIERALQLDPHRERPYVMVSLNDGPDPHFRKASFLAHDCLRNCEQPCIPVCPTHAITGQGVQTELCYGCGRCLGVCPIQLIHTYEQIYSPDDLQYLAIDAVEIHTQPHRYPEFQTLWQKLQPLLPQLELISISCGDHQHLDQYFQELLTIMTDAPPLLIWQTDGRPMSGDIGAGTTHPALKLGEKVLAMDLPRGFVQLAGGTNHTTASKARQLGINPHGYAYGSYARTLVADLLAQADDRPMEHDPQLLNQAVQRAKSLVNTVKLEISAHPSSAPPP